MGIMCKELPGGCPCCGAMNEDLDDNECCHQERDSHFEEDVVRHALGLLPEGTYEQPMPEPREFGLRPVLVCVSATNCVYDADSRAIECV
jgi:hypothetical protein